MESMHLKNLEPPLSTTKGLEARWTFDLSASASILIFGCFHHHLQIEALSESKSSVGVFQQTQWIPGVDDPPVNKHYSNICFVKIQIQH